MDYNRVANQYFFNSSGDYVNEVVHAFTEIGAIKTAEICKKALAAVDGSLPVERTKRVEMLNALESDELNELLEECDDIFDQWCFT